MNVSSFLTKSIKHLAHLNRRLFCNVTREELAVQTFCNIHVDVPYNVRIKPLDVHKHQESNLLKIELDGVRNPKNLVHKQTGDTIKIFATSHEYGDINGFCNIQVPVKANLNVKSHGDIFAGVLSSSKLIIQSTAGNIFLDAFEGDTVNLITVSGDIVLNGAVVASNINVHVTNNGSIKTKRIQGLSGVLKTAFGNINVDSSYCDSILFQSDNGALNLKNIHKNSRIILRNGQLNLNGLDGQIDADLQNATAHVQIARILDDSSIKMIGKGELKLAVSPQCQDDTHFEINATNPTIDPNLRLVPSKNKDTLYLTPMTENYKNVIVDCEDGVVNVTGTSWMEILKRNMKMRTE